MLTTKILIFVSINFTNGHSGSFIHLGNLINTFNNILLEEKNFNINFSDAKDDLYIFIHNFDSKFNQNYNYFIYELLKGGLKIICDEFQILLNNKFGQDYNIIYSEFYKFLQDLHFKNNNYKTYSLKLKNRNDFSDYYKYNSRSIKIIHNKKSIEFRTLNELYENLESWSSRNILLYDLTIIILEGDEKFLLLFVKSILRKYRNQIFENNLIEWKIFFKENLSSILNYQLAKDKDCVFINKVSKKEYMDLSFANRFSVWEFQESYFLYNFMILYNSKICINFYGDEMRLKYCCLFNLKCNRNQNYKFQIYIQTNREKSFEIKKDEIVLKETVFIVHNDNNNIHVLTKFSYYLRMCRKPGKENKDEKKEEIKFKNKSERVYFNNLFINGNDLKSNFIYLPMYNFIKKNKLENIKERMCVFYNDKKNNQINFDNKLLKKIVILNVLDFKNEEIKYGQTKIQKFLFRFKQIVKYGYSNFDFLRNNYNFLNTDFTIDLNEIKTDIKFVTDLSIDALFKNQKIKNSLKNFFNVSEIFGPVFYDFIPTVYIQKFDFDPSINLEFIDKQVCNNEIDLETIRKNEIYGTKYNESIVFLRFYYRIIKKSENKDLIYKVQFYYYENKYKIFLIWLKEIKIIDLYCNQHDLNINVIGYEHKINSINIIYQNLNKNVLFGLILNKKFRKNILKGICYQYLLFQKPIVKNLINQNSIFLNPEFERKLFNFEQAFFICNLQVIKIFEENLSTKLKFLKDSLKKNEFESIEKKTIFRTTKLNIFSILSFNYEHIEMIKIFENVLFLILQEFKKYLSTFDKNFNCIVTKSSKSDFDD